MDWTNMLGPVQDMEEEEKKPPTKGKAFIAKAIQRPWNELVEELQKANVPRRNIVNDEDGREVIRFVPIKK